MLVKEACGERDDLVITKQEDSVITGLMGSQKYSLYMYSDTLVTFYNLGQIPLSIKMISYYEFCHS